MIYTNRLTIRMASCEEMEALIAAQTDRELQSAYQQMLDGVRENPSRAQWYAVWMIERRDGTMVGDLSFKGIPEEGMVEIGYGILESWRGRGYATEAVMAMVLWAEQQPGVCCIEAETDPDNRISQRVLAKCGFISNHVIGEEGPRFVWSKAEAEQGRAKRILRLREHPEMLELAVEWFHEKWNIPLQAYRQSMQTCISQQAAVPQWYLTMDGERILAGMGVIENDFHNCKDLSPNVCAVYTEPDKRNRGIAGELLHEVCEDMKSLGVHTLYLVTDHEGFYERYGWNFLCMVQGDGESHLTRMYVHE